MKKLLLLILVTVLLSSSASAIVIDGYEFPDFTCNNGFCWVDDSQIYINATENSKGSIDLWVMTKSYTGNLNLGFLYSRDDITPTSIKYYNPHTVNIPYYDLDGSYLYDVEAPRTFSSLNKQVQTRQFNFDNKDTLKYITNLPVTANNINHLSINFKSNNLVSKTKYDIILYPSFYGSDLTGALNNGHLYLLDPYFEGNNTIDSLNRSNRALNGDTADNGRDWIAGGTTAPDIASFRARFEDTGTNPYGWLGYNSINTSNDYALNFSFILQRSSSIGNVNIILTDGNNTGSWDNYSIYLQALGLQLRVRNGGSWTNIVSISAGTNYNVVFYDINLTSRKYSLKVGTTEYDNGGAGYSFSTDTSYATHFDNFGIIYGGGSGGNYVYIDELIMYSSINESGGAPPATPNLDVFANGNDDVSSILKFNASVAGAGFWSTTNGTINTNITQNGSIYTFVVDSDIHFPKTYANWNSSLDLYANLTQYPYITIRNDWNDSALTNVSFIINGTTYKNETGIKVYVPFNTTEWVFINKSGYITRNISFNFANSNDLNTTIWQSEINIFGKEVVTNNTINVWNLTIGSIVYNATASNITLKPNFDTYTNWVGRANGYYNLSQDYTVTQQYQNFTALFYTHLLNITINNSGGAPVNSVIVDVDGLNYTFNTTATANGYYEFGLINGSYRISIDPPNYNIDTAIVNISANDTYLRFNFQVEATNSITFNFYDEGTTTLIDYATISLEMIGDSDTYNATTTTGTAFIDAITPDYYTIRYSAPHTTERFYYFTLVNRTTNTLNLYLVNQSLASNVTALVYDENINYLENALIKVLRYDIDTNSYILQEMRATNFEGEATLSLVLNEEFYKYIVEYPTGTTELITSPTYATSTSIEFQLVLAEAVGATFFNSQQIAYTLTYNNATNNFNYVWNDGANAVVSGCMYVYKVTYLSDTLFNSTCINGTSGNILLGAPQVNGTTYKANAYVYYGQNNNDEYYLTSLFVSWLENANTGQLGLFGIIILTIVFALMGFWSPIIAVILTPIPMVLGSATGLIALSLPITISIWALAIVVGYIISK
jgi:hypothetical protein